MTNSDGSPVAMYASIAASVSLPNSTCVVVADDFTVSSAGVGRGLQPSQVIGQLEGTGYSLVRRTNDGQSIHTRESFCRLRRQSACLLILSWAVITSQVSHLQSSLPESAGTINVKPVCTLCCLPLILQIAMHRVRRPQAVACEIIIKRSQRHCSGLNP